MKITTKRKALALSVETLFKGKKTATKINKFCTGKYAWKGSVKQYEGLEVVDIEGVLAVWMERRQDQDGAYAQMMSLSY